MGAADAVFRGGLQNRTTADDVTVAGIHPLESTVARRPDLPDAMHVNGEPMDLAYVVGVLPAHRDLERRLAAENGGGGGRLGAVA